MTYANIALYTIAIDALKDDCKQPFLLTAGVPSGYLPQFQNTLDDQPGWNGDQGHHFAAFFDLGYFSGRTARLVAVIYERGQAAARETAVNQGDIDLGIQAAQIGLELGSGTIGVGDVAGRIQNLCRR